MELSPYVWQIFTAIGTSIGALATIAAFATARRAKPSQQPKAEAPLEPGEVADQQTESRVTEAKAALSRAENFATWERRSTSALEFSQYVVGVVLATSFVQEHLSSVIVGFLGLLVFAASVIHQRYRPDLRHQASMQRAARLREIIRHAEDGLYALNAGRKDAPSIFKIRTMVSAGLAEVERAEIDDYRGLQRNAAEPKDAA